MYLNVAVPIPDDNKVITKKVNDTEYVYYEVGRKYNSEKKYNVPKRKCIGKVCKDRPGMMFPNTVFLQYFPDTVLIDDADGPARSSIRRTGIAGRRGAGDLGSHPGTSHDRHGRGAGAH